MNLKQACVTQVILVLDFFMCWHSGSHKHNTIFHMRRTNDWGIFLFITWPEELYTRPYKQLPLLLLFPVYSEEWGNHPSLPPSTHLSPSSHIPSPRVRSSSCSWSNCLIILMLVLSFLSRTVGQTLVLMSLCVMSCQNRRHLMCSEGVKAQMVTNPWCVSPQVFWSPYVNKIQYIYPDVHAKDF